MTPLAFELMRFVQPMLRGLICVPVMCSRSTSFLLLGNEATYNLSALYEKQGDLVWWLRSTAQPLHGKLRSTTASKSADTRGHAQHMWMTCCPSPK